MCTRNSSMVDERDEMFRRAPPLEALFIVYSDMTLLYANDIATAASFDDEAPLFACTTDRVRVKPPRVPEGHLNTTETMAFAHLSSQTERTLCLNQVMANGHGWRGGAGLSFGADSGLGEAREACLTRPLAS